MPYAKRKHTDIVEALNSQKSDRAIAKDLNVHHATVWSWRKKYNILKKELASQTKVHAEIVTAMLKNADTGVCMTQMVNTLHIDRRKIYWILRRLYDKGNVVYYRKVGNYKWYWIGEK